MAFYVVNSGWKLLLIKSLGTAMQSIIIAFRCYWTVHIKVTTPRYKKHHLTYMKISSHLFKRSSLLFNRKVSGWLSWMSSWLSIWWSWVWILIAVHLTKNLQQTLCLFGSGGIIILEVPALPLLQRETKFLAGQMSRQKFGLLTGRTSPVNIAPSTQLFISTDRR